jgi:cytochrome c oxidase assembly protein Cox11
VQSSLPSAEFSAQPAARTDGTSRHNIEAHDIVNVEGYKIAACRRSVHCFCFDHALSDPDDGPIWIISDDLEDADAATTILWRSDS